jgi:pilus assembly protein Flp/PilA
MFTLSKLSWTSIKSKISSIKNDQSGQGMVEYVLIIALIAVVLIVVFSNVATAISDKLGQVVGALGGGS